MRLRINCIQNKAVILIPLLFLVAINSINPSTTINLSTSYMLQEPPIENVAFTRVNVTLTDSDTSYERVTILDNIDATLPVERLFVLAKLTTHGDIYFQLDIEIPVNAEAEWNESLTLFLNSSLMEEVKSFEAMEGLLGGSNITLLEITSSSFSAQVDNRTDGDRFFVEQKAIFKQTTAFLLTLPEPFQFGLNKLELGHLADFHFQFEYLNFEGENAFAIESVRIKAPGSALTYIPTTSSYTGTIYLTEFPWDAFRVPRYFNPSADAPQDIHFSIKLPIGQNEITYDYDQKYKTAMTEESEVLRQKNQISFFFEHDSYIPHAIYLDSVTPFFEQFSLMDYFSMFAGIFAALFTLLRGLPFVISRWSFNRYKNGLIGSLSKKSWDKKDLEDKVQEKFISGKLSTSQYTEINRVISLLKEEKTGNLEGKM